MSFIHYTNSSVLEIFPYCEFQLLDVRTLLSKYGFAPISGELSNIGATDKVEPAFAKIGDTYWTSDGLYRSYGQQNCLKKDFTMESLRMLIDEIPNTSFYYLFANLIRILRVNQMGLLPQLSEQELSDYFQNLDKKLDEVSRKFAANYIWARFILEDKKAKGWDESDRMLDIVRTFYKKIPANFLDLSTKEQLELLNAHQSDLSPFFKIQDKRKAPLMNEPEVTNNFALEIVLDDPVRNDYTDIVLMFSEKDITAQINYAEKAIRETLENIESLNKILKETLTGQNTFRLSEEIKTAALNPFPIAFILESDKHLEKNKYEFRATKPLVLGQDITIIATDKANISRVQEYCKKHAQLANIKVISFSEINEYKAKVRLSA